MQAASKLLENLAKLCLRAALITVTRLNQQGASPLHLAIVRGLSDAWIRRLLWAHRLAASAQDNDVKMTPLHVALRYRRTSISTVNLLIDAHPAALVTTTKRGFIPLHVASEFSSSVEIICLLLSVNPEGTVARTLAGDTPLHLACGADRPCGDEIVLTLIDREPCAVNIRNGRGQTPLSIACGIWDNFTSSSEGKVQLDGVDHASDMDGVLRRLWNKICYLAKAIHHLKAEISMSSSTLLSDRFLLHAVIGAGCPSSFIRLVMKFHPYQALEGDQLSRLPLSIAASATFQTNQDALETIEELICANPEAAGVIDSCGNYPLHLAIENKKTWHHGVRSIFLAYPDVLNVADVSSGMYPFMVAAMKGVKQGSPEMSRASDLDFGPKRGSIRSRSDSFDEYEMSFRDIFIYIPSLRCWDEDLDSDSDGETRIEEEQFIERVEGEQIVKQLAQRDRNGKLSVSPSSKDSEVAQIDTIFNLMRSSPCALEHGPAPRSL